MRSLMTALAAGALATTALVSTSASAAQIGAGNLSVAALYNPAVNLAAAPATYTATLGNTFEVTGTGAFAPASGLTGAMNGTLSFSSLVGTTLSQTVPNFFTFADGSGSSFSFTPTSVQTRSYSDVPGVSSSFSLFVLGNTLDTVLGFDPTPTSLTLSFNSTGGSPYAASATLSIPPVGTVPEPGTWGLMLTGVGLLGGVVRRQRKTKVTFANA